jgi:hypothetical protein
MDVEQVVNPPPGGQSDTGTDFANSLTLTPEQQSTLNGALGGATDAVAAFQKEFTAEFYRQEAGRNSKSHELIMDTLLTQERVNGDSIRQEQLGRTDGGNAPTNPNGGGASAGKRS